jgi:YD repeat-containing protein
VAPPAPAPPHPASHLPFKHSTHLDLGSFSTGSPSAGTIDLAQPITNLTALTPASFQINQNQGWTPTANQFREITTAEERQILTPLSFIRIHTTAPGIVRIDFHPAADAQPPASGQTLHTTNAAPHTSHIYQKLTREGFSSGLQHTTIANGKTTVESFFAITSATGTHTLHIAPDGTHTDTQEAVTSSIPAGRSIETNRYLLDGTTQLPISRTFEAYAVKPWGKEALVSTTNGIAPNAQTTTHAYYENDQLPGYKEKRQTIHPDGSWTTWLYSTTLDGKSYLSHTLTPWLDAAAPLASATVANAVANSRATHHDETGAITHETILGSTVLTRETTGTTNGETATTTPASGNSVTTATLYHNAPFNALPGTKGPLALTVSEDLSATYYNQAEIGTFDTTTQAFSLLPGGLDTRNTTTTGRVTNIGLIFNTVPGQSTRTTTITRKGLGTIRRTLEVLIGGTWQPANTTTYTYDAQGNLSTTTTNGDTTTHPAPGDPNATVQTDTSDTGEVTITTTDATTGETLSIVRQGTATQAHIVTTFATTRAANGNQTRVTTTFAANDPDANGTYTPIPNTTTTSSVTTDLLGRTLSSTDELGTLTTYTYPDPLTTTQTRNGVTVTTTRHLDGQLKTTSGTGTIPEHNTYSRRQRPHRTNHLPRYNR